VNATFGELRAAGVPTIGACALIGRSRATHYRHARGPLHGPRPARSVPDNGQALSAAERQAVLTLINTEAYADLSIGQIWARELDAGNYLCSASSMYRIAGSLDAMVPRPKVGMTGPTPDLLNVDYTPGYPQVGITASLIDRYVDVLTLTACQPTEPR